MSRESGKEPGREPKEIKFEAALGKLEEIVGRMEGGDLSLDESLKLFEEGVRLARHCSSRLDAAEKKIEILMRNEDGGMEAVPFEPDEPARKG